MAVNANLKKIEKLRKKIAEINERMKNEVQQKQEYMKEIEALEAESLVSACKSSNITFSEAVESFDIFKKLKADGIKIEDIKELLASEQKDSETLSPVEMKSEEDTKND